MANDRRVLALDIRCLPPEPPLQWTLTLALAGHAAESSRWTVILGIITLWVIYFLRLIGTRQIDIFETWRNK